MSSAKLCIKYFHKVVLILLIISWVFSGWPNLRMSDILRFPPEIKKAFAAVAHDLATESHTGTTGSTNQASFSWSHAGAASGVKGVLVFVFNANNTGDDSTSVTYGGVSLSTNASWVAADTVTEPGRTRAWFLGSGVPQGTQTVVVNRNNNANIMYAIAITVTGASDTEIYTAGVVLLQENGTWAEQNVDDGSPGTNSVRYAGNYTGAASPTAAGANSTALQSIDLGAFGAGAVRETTAGQGSRPVGFSNATADDRATVHLAVREIPPPAVLSWDTGASDFKIYAGATPTSDAVLTWNNGTLICSSALNDSNSSLVGCGSINRNQKYRVQAVLKNTGGTAAVMAGASEFVDHKNTKTFWAGTSPTISASTDCGFNDTDADDTATTCNVAFNGNDVRITNTGTSVRLAATTGSEGFMYLITTDSDVPISDVSSYMNAFIDNVTQASSLITIGLKRIPGLFVRGKTTIRGKVKFR